MSRHARSSHVVLGVLVAGCFGACDPPELIDPLVGSWTSSMPIADEHNDLELDASLEGEARIYFYYEGAPYYADFDVLATSLDDGRYQLGFDCIGDCSDLDFHAWCNFLGPQLVCEANGPWDEYVFEWERV